MSTLPPVGWPDVATTHEAAVLRADIAESAHHLEATLDRCFDNMTRTVVRWMLLSQVATVFVVMAALAILR